MARIKVSWGDKTRATRILLCIFIAGDKWPVHNLGILPPLSASAPRSQS